MGVELIDVTKEMKLRRKKKEKLKKEKSFVQSASEWNQIKTKVFRGHSKDVTSCDFISDKIIISGSADESVIIWDISNGAILKTFDGAHQGKVTKVVVSPDAKCFATTGWDKKIRMWNLESSLLMWTGVHTGLVTYCSFSNESDRVVTCTDRDNIVIIWNSENGEIIHQIKDLHTSTITSVQFTKSGDRILTTSYDRTAVVSDLVSGTSTAILRGHTNIIADAAITEDERWVATVSWDKSINLYDITTGMYREKGPRTIDKAHEGCISCCDFSKDGALLVTGGYDLRVCVWDVNELVRRHKLQGHTDWVVDVKFNSDASFILSGAKDKQLRLWNIGEEVISDVNPERVFKQKVFQVKLENCIECGKSFSITYEHVKQNVKSCVICRLQSEPTDYTKDFLD